MSEPSSLRTQREDGLRRVRALLLILLAMTAGTIYTGYAFARHAGASAASWKWVALFSVLLLLLLVELVSLGFSFSRRGDFLVRLLELAESLAARGRVVAAGLSVLLLPVFPLLVRGPYGVHLTDLYARLALFAVLTLAGGMLLRGARLVPKWEQATALYGLVLGVVCRVIAFVPDVTTYPLSLGWSEGSRFYYASLFFAPRIYGVDAAWPVLHPSRYLLQALPFLIPGLPLWFHRLWQVLLWLGMTGLGAWLVVRRVSPTEKIWRWILLGWAFLFFFQARVYYHLMVSLIIILAGFDSSRFGRSLLVVLLASVWAGISRVNWFPVPALMASLLYLLERPFPIPARTIGRYGWPIVVWVSAGLLTAAGSGLLYATLSGNDLGRFGSSFTSDLLWYRLFPNATYGPGILRGVFVLTLPLLLWLGLRVRWWLRAIHPLRLAGLGGIVLALLGAGIIVSLKIGGGGDLHNMDAYVSALLLVAAYAQTGRIVPDREVPGGGRALLRWVLMAVLVAPAFWTSVLGGPAQPRDMEGARRVVTTLREALKPQVERGGRVLFLSERHLLTFGLIGDVPLVPEYEKVFLMEMAMSRNEDYLSTFYGDLERHAFDVIVTAPLSVDPRGSGHRFGDEDDIWSQSVAAPILRTYQPAQVLEPLGLWLMVPVGEEGASKPVDTLTAAGGMVEP